MAQTGLLDELARFEAEMRGLDAATATAGPTPPQPRPAPTAPPRPPQMMGHAPALIPPPGPPPQPPMMPQPPVMPMPPVYSHPPPPGPGYGMPMYHMSQMPPPPQFQLPTAMDPAVLAHMRQQMGAAAAASATAQVNAQAAAVAKAAGGKIANSTIDVKKLHFREAAGEKWVDPSLSEWPENDFRIFVGNLGSEVNDDVITKAFMKYPSFNKAKVVRDKKSNKSKGYGFASFSEQSEMYKVLKEMEGKYIGNRPCKLKRSTWDKREIESTPELVENAVKKLKTSHELATHVGKDRRKHVNILHK